VAKSPQAPRFQRAIYGRLTLRISYCLCDVAEAPYLMNDEAKSKEALIEELKAARRRLDVAERELARRGVAGDAERERHRVERELRQQEERLHLIVEGVRDHAISMLDPAGRIVTFNRAAQQIKGHALEDVRGHYFGLFFTPEDRASGLPELELKTAREHGRYEGEGWREGFGERPGRVEWLHCPLLDFQQT